MNICNLSAFLKIQTLLNTPIILTLILISSSCKNRNLGDSDLDWDTICVTATAYNSVDNQTEGNPGITAWGDTLRPGMNVVAVSRDLMRMGLDHNARIKIEGFDSIFLVKDKMHYRWRNRIDIYMGNNVEAARKFGRKKLNIAYIYHKDSITY